MKVFIGFLLGIAAMSCFIVYSGGGTCFALAYLALYAPPLGWIAFAVVVVVLVMAFFAAALGLLMSIYQDFTT